MLQQKIPIDQCKVSSWTKRTTQTDYKYLGFPILQILLNSLALMNLSGKCVE